ncbi:hypothetical protein [Streptomyces celluloflavus]|uniref:hypothetical protein n=1 Tax=Streptomyces celluloflavus TaxID=58344 RepID=UPI0036C84AAF
MRRPASRIRHPADAKGAKGLKGGVIQAHGDTAEDVAAHPEHAADRLPEQAGRPPAEPTGGTE